MQVESVSDTARWVAHFRANEAERPDALFSDPFARKLAGERGAAVARALPAGGGEAVVAIRTRLIDDLIMEAVAGGVDTVLSLAAGLDARPYRLALPPKLRWIEADLPAILAEKEAVLAGDVPRCQLIRVPVDLADGDARRQLLSDVDVGAARTLVLTEGLLVYLAPADVAALARDLRDCPSFRLWIADTLDAAALARMQRVYNRQLAPGRAEMRWAMPPDGAGILDRGWRERAYHPIAELSRRWRRPIGPAGWFMWLYPWLPAAGQERIRRLSGIAVWEPNDVP